MLSSVLKSLRRPAPPPGERRLHIGGTARAPGWEVLNAVAGPAVDHVGSAADLRRFADGTFAALYGSHVLEHLDYKGELQAGLREWHRVLAPGGTLYVSVPDLAVLARLVLADGLTLEQRFMVVRMIFGGHVDAHDYHQMGFDLELLAAFLREAGFVAIERVADLGVFDDTSRVVYAGVPISLNVIARKPGGPT
jgi:predicted SAM-dependent methyltransferase